MECFVRNGDQLLIRVYRLPSISELQDCDAKASELVRQMANDITVRCEIFGLHSVPTKGHMRAISEFLHTEQDKIAKVVVAHKGGRLVRRSHRLFLRMFTPVKPVKIERLNIYDEDEDFELV